VLDLRRAQLAPLPHGGRGRRDACGERRAHVLRTSGGCARARAFLGGADAGDPRRSPAGRRAGGRDCKVRISLSAAGC
jgi:hypothetical protein